MPRPEGITAAAIGLVKTGRRKHRRVGPESAIPRGCVVDCFGVVIDAGPRQADDPAEREARIAAHTARVQAELARRAEAAARLQGAARE